MNTYYGDKIIDAIISGAFIKIEDVATCGGIMEDGTEQFAQVTPHNHLSIWSSNASEQLDALVRSFIDQGITAYCRNDYPDHEYPI